MKVIVKENGFYGGTYYTAGEKPVEMPDAVAKQFMQPYGHQLEKPEDRLKTLKAVKE